MARRSRGRRSGGWGVSKIFMGPIVLLTALGLFYGIARVNNIHSISDGINYLRTVSHGTDKKVDDCLDNTGNCKIIPDTSKSTSDDKQNAASGDSSGSEGTGDTGAQSQSVNEHKTALDNLTVAPSHQVAYKRSEWKHWIDVNGKCNAREEVLVRQGKNVKTDPKTCRVISGTWVDPYSGQTITDPKKIDIDHIIPLGYVARSGGQDWSAEKKQEYANDVDKVLLAVSATENRSKSDKGPAQYMPPNSDYACQYSKEWIDIAGKYKISITQEDKQALSAGLDKCK